MSTTRLVLPRRRFATRRHSALPLAVLLLALLAPSLLRVPQAQAQSTPPTLTTSDSASFPRGSSPVVISPNLLVSGAENITGALVLITDNFVSSSDALGISGQSGTSGTVSGINWSYNPNSGVLTLTGTATPATYQSVLRQVTFLNTNVSSSAQPRRVVFSLGNSLPHSESGHYYEFVVATDITWLEAKPAAAARRLFGLQGYLTTITSQGENDFVSSRLVGEGWMGASDDNAQTGSTEGHWYWVSGPEAGQEFFNTTIGPVGGRYNNWADGEPNNAGGENYAHFLSNGQWNDYPNTASVSGYVVEYGGLAGDPSLQITDDVTVTITLTTPTISQPLTPVNSANRGAYTISGSCTGGLQVTVTVGSATSTVTCQGNGTYSATLDLSALADAASLAVTARQSDGTLTSSLANASVRKDTVAAPLTINAPRPVISQLNRATYPFGGACEASATITLTISTQSKTVTCAANGSYFTTFDLTSLPDAASVPLSARQRDSVGNSAGPVNSSALKDTIAAPLTINTPRPPINLVNRTNYPVGGACEAGGSVTIQIGSIQRSTPCLSNSTYITYTNVSSLADAASISIVVRQRDRYSNVGGPINSSALKDTVAPPVTISSTSPISTRLPTFNGTSEANATVTIIIDLDNNNATTSDRVHYRTTASAAGQWSVNLATATPLSGTLPAGGLPRPGTISLAAIARDIAGNQGTPINKPIVVQ